MDLTKNFKAQAENLRLALATMNIEVSAAQAVELIAAQYTQDTWAKLRASLNNAPEPKLGDGQKQYYYESIEIDLGDGAGPQWCSIEHGWYNSELIGLVHDEKALRAHLAHYAAANVYGSAEPEDVVILGFHTDRGREYTMKASEFLGIRYEGEGYWVLKSGQKVRFNRTQDYVPELESPFEVPKLLKSTKGCYLIHFSRRVKGLIVRGDIIMPPGRDATNLKLSLQKLVDEMEKDGPLKDIDAFKRKVTEHVRGFGAEVDFSAGA